MLITAFVEPSYRYTAPTSAAVALSNFGSVTTKFPFASTTTLSPKDWLPVGPVNVIDADPALAGPPAATDTTAPNNTMLSADPNLNKRSPITDITPPDCSTLKLNGGNYHRTIGAASELPHCSSHRQQSMRTTESKRPDMRRRHSHVTRARCRG